MDEKDNQLTLKEYNSKFVTYELYPSIYPNKDITEVLLKGFKSESEIRRKMQPNVKYDRLDSFIIEYDDIAMRAKLIVKSDILALSLIKNHFLILS